MGNIEVGLQEITDVRDLIDAWGEDPQRFTPWERDFIKDLDVKVERYGSEIFLSANQYTQVTRMLEEKVRT